MKINSHLIAPRSETAPRRAEDGGGLGGEEVRVVSPGRGAGPGIESTGGLHPLRSHRPGFRRLSLSSSIFFLLASNRPIESFKKWLFFLIYYILIPDKNVSINEFFMEWAWIRKSFFYSAVHTKGHHVSTHLSNPTNPCSAHHRSMFKNFSPEI